jgi:uncharacterized protein
MKKNFSIPLFVFIVILFSWPFQFWYVFKAETAFDKYLYSSLSMIMVTVAAFIAGRFVFKNGFDNAGWRWGKPLHYLLVFLFAFFLWLFPVVIEISTGINKPHDTIEITPIFMIFIFRFVATLLPAFGEEFGWRGYLLPKLVEKFTAKKALLIHAFIWWAWHLPVIVGMELQSNEVSNNQFVNVAAITLFSSIPAMLHAIIFAFIWSKTKSLAVVTVYHAAFDEVRDALENSVGFGPFVNNWQMIVIIITGGLLLWKADWNKLLLAHKDTTRYQSIAVNRF